MRLRRRVSPPTGWGFEITWATDLWFYRVTVGGCQRPNVFSRVAVWRGSVPNVVPRMWIDNRVGRCGTVWRPEDTESFNWPFLPFEPVRMDKFWAVARVARARKYAEDVPYWLATYGPPPVRSLLADGLPEFRGVRGEAL